MKISRQLKSKIQFTAFQLVTGQLQDLEALAEILRSLLSEVEKQLNDKN